MNCYLRQNQAKFNFQGLQFVMSILLSVGLSGVPNTLLSQDFSGTREVVIQYSSKKMIAVGFVPGLTFEEKSAVFEAEPMLAPFHSSQELIGSGIAVATPPIGTMLSSKDLKALLSRLQAHPGVLFAHPFLENEKGSLFGITNELYVKLAPDQPESFTRLKSMALLANAQILGPDLYLPGVYKLQTDKHSLGNPVELAVWMEESGFFAYAAPNYLFNPIVATNDLYFKYQWHLRNDGTTFQGDGTPGADMKVEDAWTLTTGDPSIKVAILDSGTDTLHPDLVDNLLSGYDATGGGTKGYPNIDLTQNGHGTACSGIIGAKGNNSIGVAGVCYDCSIVPVRVFYYQDIVLVGIQPWSTGGWMAGGINWASQTADADVLSQSWGLPDFLLFGLPDGTQIVEDAIATAAINGRGGLGLPMLFSSGNDGGAPIWPGRMAQAITVNASSQCDERKSPTSCDGENWEGNWGDSLDVTAPGVRITTTDMTGNLGYTPGDYTTTFNGTSAACPNAAGVMGLILSLKPTLTLSEARAILEGSCDKVGGYAYNTIKNHGSWSIEMGYGRLNAYKALQSVGRDPGLDARGGNSQGLFLEIWPNPTHQFMNLRVLNTREGENIDIHLTDSQGRQIKIDFTELIQASGNQRYFSLDFRGDQLSTGIYFLEARQGQNRATGKVIYRN